MKLNVDHLVVVSQTVEVPDTCPSCEADLTEEGALKQWEFQDQSRMMTSTKFDKESFWCVMVEVSPDKWERYPHAVLWEDPKNAEEEIELILKWNIEPLTLQVQNLPEDEYELDCCNDLPQSGECFISCGWHCARCDTTLFAHNEIRFNMEDSDRLPPPGLQDLMKLDAKTG